MCLACLLLSILGTMHVPYIAHIYLIIVYFTHLNIPISLLVMVFTRRKLFICIFHEIDPLLQSNALGCVYM